MFESLKKRIYYLWHGETKEEHDKRLAEAKAVQDELDRKNRELIAQLEARRQEEERRRAAEELAEERRRAREERAQRAKEQAYQKFLETNEVTQCDAPPELDDNEINEQRRMAMRFAKDLQDSMPD